MPVKSTVFISHSSADDALVRELQRSLEDLGLPVWIDSRQLRGGNPLWETIQRAIADADAYAVLLSPEALQSSWVADELEYALQVQQERVAAGIDYRVIPLSLNGTKLGVAGKLFGAEPVYIPISSEADGVQEALYAILIALGWNLPPERLPSPPPPARPLAELVLELREPRLVEKAGILRAVAKARLVYEPAAGEAVYSPTDWTFTAPLGPIELDELRWYLEEYYRWPGHVVAERAQRVEGQLQAWGKLLYAGALPSAPAGEVLHAWADAGQDTERRFSVFIKDIPSADSTKKTQTAARAAATALLALPWELLHNGRHFLFQGAREVRVRRRLPNTQPRELLLLTPPIRVLLVSPRPEDEVCGYIDHRASALPLVEAVSALGKLVCVTLLDPPTYPALLTELDRARKAGQPYHVLHFDGHGVYSREYGLGGLCFEDPADAGKLTNRRSQVVYTDKLVPDLHYYRTPLAFLDACQSAQAEGASGSVASGLLQTGVASVVAMSHCVLVETARRFMEAFYHALTDGARVGEAMFAGQRLLYNDPTRLCAGGVEELRLQDWFAPVLYQEKDDPRLFRKTLPTITREIVEELYQAHLGATPPPPPGGFIGRSRELLTLQRLLHLRRYAVLRGNGGEGKTALAAELARWLVRSEQIDRAAYVSLEHAGTAPAVLDALGRQLLPCYSVVEYPDLEQAEQPVIRALQEHSTLLVVDNVESLLPPPAASGEADDALTADMREELAYILTLCHRLNAIGDTRLLLITSEAPPAPFDDEFCCIEADLGD